MDVTIPCPCPEKAGAPRHESDTVTLHDVLDFHQSMTITKSVQFIDEDDPDSRGAEVLARLSEFYILVGIARWSLRDASNKPIEVTKGAIRKFILSRPDIASKVEPVADSLYREVILLPLLEAASISSQPSPTDDSTSPTPHGPTPQPKPSKRSSTSTIQTDGIGSTSGPLAGDFKSSPRSDTAGWSAGT